MKRLEVEITGDVQGVFFRDFAVREARVRGITGTVTNAPDGSVRVVAEGEMPELEVFLLRLQAGPRSAKISEVKAQWAEAENFFSNFKIV